MTGGTKPSPFAAIAAPPPNFSAAEVMDIALQHYGLRATATPLVSERDQNYLLRSEDGTQTVFKIANATEERAATLMQISALKRVASQTCTRDAVPAVLPTRAGASHVVLQHQGCKHIGRLVTYLSGTPLADVPLTGALCRDFGAFLAHVDRALADLTYADIDQALMWDMKRAPALRDIFRYVHDRATRRLLEQTLSNFETEVLPRFERLRWQVIHNDANPSNVLVGDDGCVSGLIDFGDLAHSPLIVELAVAAAYLRPLEGDPCELLCEFLAGYNAVNALQREETELLYDAIKMRLATTVAIMAWRTSLRAADDAYLQQTVVTEGTALTFLRRLADTPRHQATQAFLRVCETTASI